MACNKAFYERLARSRARWKPTHTLDEVVQIIGVAAGYTTAGVCRAEFTDAAREIIARLKDKDHE